MLIYNPDAIGQWLIQKYTDDFAPVMRHTQLAIPFLTAFPPVTPVCFATMYTGAAPEIHGIRKYEKGLLYQIISPLEDSFDLEGMVEAKKRLTGVSQRILDAFRPDPAGSTLHLAGGACGLCEKCGKETGEPCRHPDRCDCRHGSAYAQGRKYAGRSPGLFR